MNVCIAVIEASNQSGYVFSSWLSWVLFFQPVSSILNFRSSSKLTTSCVLIYATSTFRAPDRQLLNLALYMGPLALFVWAAFLCWSLISGYKADYLLSCVLIVRGSCVSSPLQNLQRLFFLNKTLQDSNSKTLCFRSFCFFALSSRILMAQQSASPYECRRPHKPCVNEQIVPPQISLFSLSANWYRLVQRQSKAGHFVWSMTNMSGQGPLRACWGPSSPFYWQAQSVLNAGVSQ